MFIGYGRKASLYALKGGYETDWERNYLENKLGETHDDATFEVILCDDIHELLEKLLPEPQESEHHRSFPWIISRELQEAKRKAKEAAANKAIENRAARWRAREEAERLKPIKDVIRSTGYAFFARLMNEKVVAWGSPTFGGDITEVKAELESCKVDAVWSTDEAFFARLMNEKVVAWGNSARGGDITKVKAELESGKVDAVWSTKYAFFARLMNEKVVAWGDSLFGGDITKVKAELQSGKVDAVWSVGGAFFARLKNDKVVTWGNCGAGFEEVKAELLCGLMKTSFSQG